MWQITSLSVSRSRKKDLSEEYISAGVAQVLYPFDEKNLDDKDIVEWRDSVSVNRLKMTKL